MPFLRSLARIWTILIGCTVLALALAVAARYLAPLAPWSAAPTLAAADPPDGASEVHPRAVITVRFSAPMNRASTAAALRIKPPTPGSLSWSPDATALTFRPTGALAADITYTVSLDQSARGRWWRPLEAPVQVQFHTAPQPAVVAALPATAGTATETALAVVFSQPMIPPEAVGRPIDLPVLRLEPPVPFRALWADQSTLVAIPEAPLSPATRYSATIDPGLADLRGVDLGTPFRWSFTTRWPALIAHTPEDQARWVSPRAPLTLHLATPLDPGVLRQALRITPSIEGDLSADVVGATQVITFTPRAGWAYGTTYSVTLAEPPGSGLGAPPTRPWQFSVEPQPRLVAYFPGQGQTLAPGEAIRLVFSTPMDKEALLAGLRIEPPVDELPISIGETEVRLGPKLRPSTLYTITLAATTADRGGEPLGAETVVSLRTAPARPALAAPAAFAGLITLPLSRTAEIELETTNLAALDLSLYPLDQPTLLRALALDPDERADFSPERYGQTLARSWRVTLSAPGDQPGRLRLPVGLTDGAPLPAGAYYLRATSPEGPRADLLLLASDTRLSLRQGPGYALVWATDSAGAPVGGLPVTLFSGSAAIARGQTGPDGVWGQALTRDSDAPPLLATATDGAPAVVRGDWQIGGQPASPTVARSLLFADRASYLPGAQIQVVGLTRRLAPDGAIALPTADTTCRLQLRAGGAGAGPLASCRIEPATGALSGTLGLSPGLAPGPYSLAAQVGDERITLPIMIDGPAPADFALTAAPVGEQELLLRATREGLPLAGDPISWRLRLEPLPPPALPAGFVLGPLATAEALTLEGRSVADAEGRVRIALPADDGAAARYYRVQTSRATGGASPGTADAEGPLPPGLSYVAVRLPSRLVASDQRSTVEILALDGLGRPTPGAGIRVAVFAAGAAGAPRIERRAVAGPDGLASVQLVQLTPGEYELVASADGPATRARLWVYGPRFAGWRADDGQLTLVPDRDRYSPGDVASLLVAAPESAGSLLVTVERGGLLGAEVRPVRASQVITVAITADMAPAVTVGAITASGSQRRAGHVSLAVAGPEPPLEVRVQPPEGDQLPGASTPVTITTTAGGSPVASDLLITVAPAQAPPPESALARFAPGPPAASAVADLPRAGQPGPADLAEAPAVTVAPPAGYAAGAGDRSNPGGVSAGRITLPGQPGRWRITAYAASGPARVAVGSAVVTTSLPIEHTVRAPATLRPGDQAAVSLLVTNTGPLTREMTVTLAVSGLDLSPQAPEQGRLTLAPGATGQLLREAGPAAGARAGRLRLTVDTPGLHEILTRELPIQPPAPPGRSAVTFVGSGPLAENLDLAADTQGDVTIAAAPGLRAALADQAAALAALPTPSSEERAALALIAAGLAADLPGAEGAPWSRLAREALGALADSQNVDGGWGWWPGTPSHPFVTAFALEAEAEARAGQAPASPASLRAIAYLSRVRSSVDADTRAYITYALTRAGHADHTSADLPEANLGPDGLAYLAMALPASQSEPLLDRIQILATREPAAPGEFAPVLWLASEPAFIPRSPSAVTAAAAQALQARRPTAPEIPGAEITLLHAWGVDGWPTAYDAARVAAALLGQAPASEGGPERISLGGKAILTGRAPITITQRVTLPAAELPARPELRVEAGGAASYLVAASLPNEGPPPIAGLTIIEELVDPVSGAALSPENLRLGQLVGIRVISISPGPLLRADLEIALPGGLEPVAPTAEQPFLHATVDSKRHLVRIFGAGLEPGVYAQMIVARAVAAGEYNAPPARLSAPYAPGQSAVAPAGVRVKITE